MSSDSAWRDEEKRLMELLTVGIDVGGTKTSCVVTDSADQVLWHDVVATNASALTAQIVGLAQRAMDNVPAGTEVAAIGVAMPGQIEPARGTAGLAVNLGAPGIDLGATVAGQTGIPCYVEHDARAAAAWVYESGTKTERSGQDLAYLSVGTGIAAGIVLDGHTLRGETGMAGEVGHMVVEPNGAPCPCGSNGCLETVAAGPAIAKAARAAVASGRATTLTDRATAMDVFAAAAADDTVAQELTENLGTHLARAIRALVLTLGVQRVAIGGGVAGGGDSFLKPILAALDMERRKSALVDTVFATASIELIPPQLEPGARGAAAIARRRLSAHEREGVGER